MWSTSSTPNEAETPSNRPDCPGCGEPDTHGDDFCFECGHAFSHLASLVRDTANGEPRATECPQCTGGELMHLDYGRRQCDSCGFTLRDEG